MSSLSDEITGRVYKTLSDALKQGDYYNYTLPESSVIARTTCEESILEIYDLVLEEVMGYIHKQKTQVKKKAVVAGRRMGKTQLGYASTKRGMSVKRSQVTANDVQVGDTLIYDGLDINNEKWGTAWDRLYPNDGYTNPDEGHHTTRVTGKDDTYVYTINSKGQTGFLRLDTLDWAFETGEMTVSPMGTEDILGRGRKPLNRKKQAMKRTSRQVPVKRVGSTRVGGDLLIPAGSRGQWGMDDTVWFNLPDRTYVRVNESSVSLDVFDTMGDAISSFEEIELYSVGGLTETVRDFVVNDSDVISVERSMKRPVRQTESEFNQENFPWTHELQVGQRIAFNLPSEVYTRVDENGFPTGWSDRTTYAGEEGTVIGSTSGMFGVNYAVQLDSGEYAWVGAQTSGKNAISLRSKRTSVGQQIEILGGEPFPVFDELNEDGQGKDWHSRKTSVGETGVIIGSRPTPYGVSYQVELDNGGYIELDELAVSSGEVALRNKSSRRRLPVPSLVSIRKAKQKRDDSMPVSIDTSVYDYVDVSTFDLNQLVNGGKLLGIRLPIGLGGNIYYGLTYDGMGFMATENSQPVGTFADEFSARQWVDSKPADNWMFIPNFRSGGRSVRGTNRREVAPTKDVRRLPSGRILIKK